MIAAFGPGLRCAIRRLDGVTLLCTLLVAGANLVPSDALAHRASNTYLDLQVSEAGEIALDLAIALRDLHIDLGLDTDSDTTITRAELNAQASLIGTHVLRHLDLGNDTRRCALTLADMTTVLRGGEPSLLLSIVPECPGPVGELTIGYHLFFGFDTSHRALATTRVGEHVQSAVLGPDQARWHVAAADAGGTAGLWHFFADGVEHILIGYDHIAFLLLLLLPAALRPAGRRWTAVPRARDAFLDAARVVTAFTLAHSITLGLAVTGLVRIPVQVAEIAIAASVVAAALVNLRPAAVRIRWLFALGFGLVHGFGFANVFSGMGAGSGAWLPPLAAFNLGVEAGQLAIVLVAVPLVIVWSRRGHYARYALPAISLSVGALALGWVFERIV